MKFVVILALCFGAVLARPGPKLEDDVESSVVLKADPNPPSPPKSSFWSDFFNHVDVQFMSLGKVDNNPAVETGINGKTYHKFSVGFDQSKYNVYVDHMLDAFEEGDAGTLAFGVDAPISDVADLSIRASQSLNSASNASLDWRIDIGHEFTTTTTIAPPKP